MNTPTKTRGVGAGKAADLTYWESAARTIAAHSTSSKIVVEKSTVPVKTAEAISKVCLEPLYEGSGHKGLKCVLWYCYARKRVMVGLFTLEVASL